MLHLFVDPQNPLMRGPTIVDQATGLQAAGAIMARLVGKGKIGPRWPYRHFDGRRGNWLYPRRTRSAHRCWLEDRHDDAVGGFTWLLSWRVATAKLIAIQLGGLHKNWIALTNALGRPDFAEDERFKLRPTRVANWLTLRDEFRPVFKSQTRDVWLERLLAGRPAMFGSPRYFPEVLDGCEVTHSVNFV